MIPIQDILVSGCVAGLLVAGVLAAWPWGRRHGRFLVAGRAAVVGFSTWYFTLNATGAVPLFNADAPVIPRSWADGGAGLMAFVGSALTLGLGSERREPAGQVVGAAALAGLVTTILDLFVI